MIRNQWYVVMESRELGKRMTGVVRMGERLAFWRDASGKPVCFLDKCAHRGASLSGGDIVGGNARCPFHGIQYRGDGKAVLIPADGRDSVPPERFRMETYPAHEAHGWIFIWWGRNPPADLAPPSYFPDLEGMTCYRTAIDPWDNHYTRAMENQLDVAHLPFVHKTTIGRGNRTLVDGPGFRWESFKNGSVYVFNRVDDGTKPKSPLEVPVPDPRGFKLELILPNLWENRISDKVRIMAAFVPVDETHTLLYLRFHQEFMKLPLLRQLTNWLGIVMSLVIAHQDRRVVNMQYPKSDGTGTGENLIQADLPIMEYRKRRQELRKSAET